MATRRKKRRTMKRTTRKTRRKTNKGNVKYMVPKGFVIISKDAARNIKKSALAMNAAIAYMAKAESLSMRAMRRTKR